MARHILASNNRFTVTVDKAHVKNVLKARATRREREAVAAERVTVIPTKGSLTDPSIGA